MFETITEIAKKAPEAITKISEIVKTIEGKEISEINKSSVSAIEPNIELIKSKSIESIAEYNKQNEIDIKLNERKLVPLSEAEAKEIQEKTQMSEATMKSLYKDEQGNIVLKCINEDLAGTQNKLGIEYKNQIVDINGIKIEVVMPEFPKVFDCKLSESKITASDGAQFNECNKQLKEAIENDPELKGKFSKRELQFIMDDNTPPGYTWHHGAERGSMELVKTDIHANTRHTGGKALWGAGR